MYVQCVSTRKVITVLQSLLGPEVSISSTQVGRAAEQLDAGLAAWLERPVDEMPYLFLDARYDWVRESGRLIDCAVLVTVGVAGAARWRVLGVSVAFSHSSRRHAFTHTRTLSKNIKRKLRILVQTQPIVPAP
jgi:putative transposase